MGLLPLPSLGNEWPVQTTTTADQTQHVIASIAIPNNTAVQIEVSAIARVTTVASGGNYTVLGSSLIASSWATAWANGSGTVTVSNGSIYTSLPGINITFTTGTNVVNVLVGASGSSASPTVNWSVVVSYSTVS